MQQSPDRVVYLFGPFRLDPAGRRLLRDGEPVGLTAKVLDVLVALVEAQGAVVERDALMDRVWPATAVVDANLTQTVSVLRKALGDTAAEHRYVATVPGRGYQFTAPVEAVRLPEPGSHEAEPAILGADGASGTEAEGRPPWRLRTARPGGRPQRRSTLLGALVVAVPLALVLVAILMALRVGGDRNHREITASGAPRSLAVLPFTVLTPNRLDPSFGAAVSAAITRTLGERDQVVVRPVEAVLAARAQHGAPRDVARSVHADLVVMGTVQATDGAVRVSSEMLDAGSDQVLWSVVFDEGMGSLLAVEQAVAERVARELALSLTDAAELSGAETATGSGAAHREVLLGHAHFLDRTREGYEKAAAAFERALDRDPTYTPALANLALTHALLASNGNTTESSSDLYIRALAEARRAIERAPDLAEGHIALGLVKMNGEYDWAAAAAELRRAKALDPKSTLSRYLLAKALMLGGDDDAAWREARSMAQPRPGLPPAAELSARFSYGLLALFLGHAEEARDALGRALAVGPDRGGVRMHFAIALDVLGDHEGALAELDRAALQFWSSSQATATLANYLGRSSDPQDRTRARQILADLEAEDEGSPGRTLNRAIAHAGAGSKAEAIRLLWQAYQERAVLPIFVQRDHRIDPLRSEPELQRLLEVMHLSPVRW